MGTVLTKKKSFPSSMKRVTSLNKLMKERYRVGDLLVRKENIGPAIEGIRFVIRETIASIAR